MEQKKSSLLRLVGVIFGLTLIVSLVIVVIGLVNQWNSTVQFSNGFFVAGLIAIVIGTFSVAGGFQQRGSFSITYAESAGQASIAERTQRMVADINQRYGMMALLIVLSIAINTLL